MSQAQEQPDYLSSSASSPHDPDHFFVVGIGASAGGLRALEEFFDHMPPDSGATFVVVQHLSPDFKSLMKELLERRTQMVVNRVRDGMKLEPNMIYLIPPRNNLIVKNRHLRLIEQEEIRHRPNFPIDLFFQSLAEDCHEKAVGVVLSGTGSDGTLGLQSISENGGVCFVQSPATAEFDGMPQSAIATGIIDRVLSPKDMAQSIYDLVQLHHLQSFQETDLVINIEQGILQRIISLLNESEKLDFSYYKFSTLSRRIYRRCSLAGYNNLQDYVAYLENSADERVLLKDDLLIGVTRFFRDPEAWHHLETQIIPNLISQLETGQQLRIWVTACSTGEEAYSMAILIHEAMEKSGKNFNVKIFATDIDNEALAKASDGIYPETIVNDISHQRLERYFSFRNKGFMVSRKLREMLIFAPHNLTKNAGFTRMHLITCRNVLIYMQPKLQQQVLRMLHFSLDLKGILFLGAAETLGEIEEEFVILQEKYRIYQKRRNVRLPIMQSENRYFASSVILPPKTEKIAQFRFDPILDQAMSNFMEERGYTCLLVNRDNELIHLIADAAKILQIPRGRITKEITAMLPKVLQMPVSTALHRARRNNRTVLYTGINLEDKEDNQRHVNVKVSFYEGDQNVEDFLMVLIEDEVRPQMLVTPEQYQVDEETAQRIVELEYELQQTKENLQATIEELETTNEEQQSTNEELLASNEELQSTNEELHSVNEELYTVNAEYQSKIQDLTQLSNDVDNLLCSTDIGVVFLDKGLKIRKFTPAATVAINLVDTDIERPIEHLTHNLDCQNLLELLQQVEQNQQPIEQEVKIIKTNDYLLMRIHPYNTDDGHCDGVVLSFIKINDLKSIQEQLGQANSELESLYLSSSVGLALYDQDLNFVRVNKVMAEINQCEVREHKGKNLTEIHPELADKMQSYLEEVLKNNQSIRSIEIDINNINFAHQKRSWLVNYYPVQLRNGRQGVGVVMTELTKIKQTQQALMDSETRFRGVFEQAAMGISILSLTGQIIQVNQKFCDFFALDQNEILGKNFAEFQSMEQESSFSLILELILTEEITYFNEERCYERSDQSLRWGHLFLSLIKDDQERPIYFILMMEDIEERKIAEILLEKQFEKQLLLQKITENIRESLEIKQICQNAALSIGEVFKVSDCLIYTYENDQLLMVAESHEQINISLTEFSSQSYFHNLLNHEGAIPIHDVENSQFVQDQREFCLVHQIKSILATGTFYHGKANGLILLYQLENERQWTMEEIDLLEIVSAQLGIAIAQGQLLKIEQAQTLELTKKNQELKQLTEASQLANETKSNFLKNMSYEIRSPMNAILGFSELLKEKISDSLSLSYLESIISSSEKLLALINDILDLSKIESNNFDLHYEPINLYQLLQDLQEIFLEQIQRKKLEFITEINPQIPQVIRFDKIRFRQILLNVIENALIVTNHGYIKVSVNIENYQELQQEEMIKTCTLIVKVEDTGMGMTPEEQNYIFEAFQHFKTANQDQYYHTGLGLTLTKRLTEILEGSVTLKSDKNKGSIFTFSFPHVQICENHILSNIELDIDPDLNQFSPQNILCIDDIQSHLDLIKAYFAHSHHQLFYGKNREETYSIMAREKIDILFLDLKIPDFDILSFIEEIKTNEKMQNVHILILSASSEFKDNLALQSKIQDFLVKPIHRLDLIKAFRKFLPFTSTIKAQTQSSLVEKIKAKILEKINPEISHKLPDLLQELQAMQREIWQELNQKHLISEIRQFSQSLQKLGIEYRYQPLLNYSYELSQSLIEFDVENITKILNQFPDIIAELKLVLDYPS